MAANETNQNNEPPSAGGVALLSAPAVRERLQEEINRAGRHGTPFSCLLVTVGNLDALAREHGEELSEQTLAYVGAALRPQLRDFDRVGRPSDSELLILLPGADGPRGEIVARRALERLRTIKVEADGQRRPLEISVGLATWRSELSDEDLLRQARVAARPTHSNAFPSIAAASPPALGRPGPS